MIVEPVYLVTRRARADKNDPPKIRVLRATHTRKSASKKAIRMCNRGLSVVVYECKIVEVHHPSKKEK